MTAPAQATPAMWAPENAPPHVSLKDLSILGAPKGAWRSARRVGAAEHMDLT